MAFLSSVSGAGKNPTPSGSSRFLGGLRQRTEREQQIAGLRAEEEKARAEAEKANKATTIAAETVKGIPGTLYRGAKSLIDDPMRVLATPVIRAEQAALTALGRATGNENLERAANQPMTLPSALGGKGGTIEPQRGFDDGGLKQIVGDAAQYGATIYTGGRAAPLAGLAKEGLIRRAAVQGAKEGAVATGAYTGGAEASRRESTAESIAAETAKGGVLGGFLGGVLGGGGAALAKPYRTVALDVADRSVPAEVSVRRFRDLPVEDANIRPGATRANARQVPINRAQEPYLSEAELPVIQAGPRAKSGLPEIQFARPVSRAKGDITYEPVRPAAIAERTQTAKTVQPSAEAPKPTRAETSAPARSKPLPAAKPSAEAKITPTQGRPVTMDVPKRTATVEPNRPKPGGTTTVSKAASDANRKLAEQGFDAIPEEQLARIGSISKADQLEKVARLLDDYESAKVMAYGEKAVPDGVAPQVLFNAVKNRAVKEGDAEALQRLARSRIAEERATAAQTLGSSGFNNEQVDALAAIRDIENTRSKVAERRRQPSDVKKEAKKAEAFIKKASAKETWNSVIDNLTC